MGAIQSSMNQALGATAGAVAIGAHMKKEQEKIEEAKKANEEAEATKKLAGLNAAANLQSKLDTNFEEAKEATMEAGEGIKDTTAAMNASAAELEKLNQRGVDISARDDKGRFKDNKGKFVSSKPFDKTVEAAQSLMDATAEKIGRQARVLRQREMYSKIGDQINAVYGTRVVVDPASEEVKKFAKEVNENAGKIKSRFQNALIEQVKVQGRYSEVEDLEPGEKEYTEIKIDGGKK